MPKFLDITGNKYGRLTVLRRAHNIGKFTAWVCSCECGKEKTILSGHLVAGRIVSCGCYKQQNSRLKATKHGMWGSKLHYIWLSMRQRCHNPKNKAYENYGGRGICITKKWNEFIDFYTWAVGNKYKEGLSIERVNNNGNYCPENCKWIPRNEQGKNTRRTLNNRSKGLFL
jgi:hypothetical protein